jgi:hypothetical protein
MIHRAFCHRRSKFKIFRQSVNRPQYKPKSKAQNHQNQDESGFTFSETSFSATSHYDSIVHFIYHPSFAGW